MNRAKQIYLTTALVLACSCALALVTSCDTPQTIAWSYYDCALDTLAAGDPYAAKHYLKACKKTVSKELNQKVDSLMEVIDQKIKEGKNS